MSVRVASAVRKHPRLVIGAFLTAVGALVFTPTMFQGAAFPWDFVGSHSTSPPYIAAAINNWDWPTWNQFQGSGQPVISNFGLGLFYPLWWLAGLFDITLTFNTMAKIQVLHVIVGSFGVVAWMRARQLPWRWAAVAGTAFLLFGGHFGQAEHANWVRGFAVLPWLLWALTAPRSGQPWTRLLAVPLIAWLTISGTYPTNVQAFALMCGAYWVVEVATHRQQVNRANLALASGVVLSAGLIVYGIVYPYLVHDGAGLLFRPAPPSQAVREQTSMDAIDVFGLYLDPWGFRFDGSVFSWAVGIPILIGLVGVTFREVRKHAAVAIMGATAAFFSIIPRVDPVGDLMVDYEIFFPSRFVFPDYKAGLALAIIVFGVVGWRNIIDHRLDRRAAAASVGLLLVWGLWAAARLAERVPTRVPLLVVVMVALGVGLATLPRSRRSLPGGVTVALLLALVIGDGFRFNYDQEFEITAQTPWIYYLPDDLRNQRDHAAAVLDDVLANPPASRPARIAPAQPVDVRPGGSPPDALGYLGLGYNMNSYNNFMTDARKNALDDPVLYERLAAPWTPWLVHCDTDDCADITELPDPALWQSTSSILTTEYGLDTIDYVVSAEETVLFVENEINFPGWQASDDRVELLEHSGSFRAWIVEPGNYSFTARYDPVEGRRQVQLFGLGLLVWIATGVWWALRCRRSVLPGLVQSGSDGVGCDDRSVRSDPAFND